MDHDHTYKLLFSHPEMVADLLPGDWVERLDFATLERLNAYYVLVERARTCQPAPGGGVFPLRIGGGAGTPIPLAMV
ncbi:hypothetical protein SAMN02949497_0603 [Methylomagnum ishizawai]|uniref:Transposase, YhgA-like n=1 Tax=Methylomagnum ishizawai TaxID=1760988 RepID=A0A1Y6CZZ4_9GAMM|nr:hypothetical protein [Methylomagnum ishizawai]SMF93325.1 hypothetical protein SAMN02949497_0603 [Methylomagnum ishizawai]